jgi:hypothetical protein
MVQIGKKCAPYFAVWDEERKAHVITYLDEPERPSESTPPELPPAPVSESDVAWLRRSRFRSDLYKRKVAVAGEAAHLRARRAQARVETGGAGHGPLRCPKPRRCSGSSASTVSGYCPENSSVKIAGLRTYPDVFLGRFQLAK